MNKKKKKNKFCPSCKNFKPITDYYKNKGRHDGLRSYCKECDKKINRSKQTGKKQKAIRLKSTFGITWDEYLNIYNSQNGKCAICNTKISIEVGADVKIRAHLDHRHSDGKIRGLLCYKHNTLLGMADDDIKILNNAINYLGSYQYVS